MRIKNLLLGASALIGMGWLFGGVMPVPTLAVDVGGGVPATGNRTVSSKHRKWQRARASGRHDFRRAL